MGKRKIGNLWEVIDLKQKETFLCIDLKSFYASVECVERGLDPFTTNLVVADPDRSVSTICLAITPAMKKLGMSFMVNTSRKHQNPVQERIWDENRKSINEGRRTSDYDRETGILDSVV